MSVLKPYAVVALVEDLLEHFLQRGQVGAVVDELGPETYEVEFSDCNGRAYAILALHSSQLMELHYEQTVKAA
ncbi:MAG: DUF4926 domain-containing protein [Acidobacteriaceae bacterium]|nr:DUF4926 domain-containing protein [Acidobacteriaceae bacterium]